jgi:hypothetical protein
MYPVTRDFPQLERELSRFQSSILNQKSGIGETQRSKRFLLVVHFTSSSVARHHELPGTTAELRTLACVFGF